MSHHEGRRADRRYFSKSLSLQRLATYPRSLGITCESSCLNTDEIKRLSRMPSLSAVAKPCNINVAAGPVTNFLLHAFLSGGDGVHIEGTDVSY
jgi:hypothetical protein